MQTYENIGKGIEVTFCPATSARPHRYGSVAHYEYYARKSKSFFDRITYLNMCEWTREICEEVRCAFEEHYNKKKNVYTSWGIMIHPKSVRLILSIKQKGYVERARVTMVFKARTDDYYPMSKHDHLIKTYFYIDALATDNTIKPIGRVVTFKNDKSEKTITNHAQKSTQFKTDSLKDTCEVNHSNYCNQNGKYGEFLGSYAQDIAGYDDDTINDAFEGDPDNCWNVD